VLGGHGRGRLGGELVELAGGDALVHAHRHLLGYQHRVAEVLLKEEKKCFSEKRKAGELETETRCVRSSKKGRAPTRGPQSYRVSFNLVARLLSPPSNESSRAMYPTHALALF
jgi:hypothetical protein